MFWFLPHLADPDYLVVILAQQRGQQKGKKKNVLVKYVCRSISLLVHAYRYFVPTM
jgi:hypothetical protein